METGIVVSVAVVGGLIALMIAGIERIYTRRMEQMLVRRLRVELVGQLDARIDLKVNENVQEMIDVVTARLLKKRYGQQEWGGTGKIPSRLQSAS